MLIHRLTEITLALLALFWGVVLMLPGDLFEGLVRYRMIAEYAPDTAWGVVMAICAIVILLRMPRWAHKHAHWILCTVWSGMTVLSLMSTIAAPALLIASLCLTVSIFHASKFWRLSYPTVTT